MAKLLIEIWDSQQQAQARAQNCGANPNDIQIHGPYERILCAERNPDRQRLDVQSPPPQWVLIARYP
jgi:hypothetical protein